VNQWKNYLFYVYYLSDALTPPIIQWLKIPTIHTLQPMHPHTLNLTVEPLTFIPKNLRKQKKFG
jgi:hypothetical protein